MVTYGIKSIEEETTSEPHMKLYLEVRYGNLYILGEDDTGREWFIAQFMSDGSLRLIRDVERSTGLNIGPDGYITVVKE